MKIEAAKPGDAVRISQLVCQLTTKYIVNEFTDDAGRTLLKSMAPDVIEKNIESGFRYHVARSAGRKRYCILSNETDHNEPA